MALAISEIDSLASWIKWADAWNELVGRQPMRSMAWLATWWEQFQTPNKQLRILFVEDEQQLVGIAPLYQMQVGSKYVLRLLGDTGDICTDHTTWFARDGYEQRVGLAIADWLVENSGWGRLHFEAVNESDPAMSATLEQLQSRGCLLHSTGQESCWAVDLPETWDEYLSSLSKNHRKRCRRWVKNFFDTGRVQIHSATADAESWQACWEVFLDLHRQRWGDVNRPDGCFSNQRFATFHEKVSRNLADSQQLRLCYLSLDGEPIASEYQLLDKQTLYSYQSGMSAAHRDIGPGNLSLVATVRYCLENGLQRLDLMRGNEPYKSHWLAQPSARADVRVWRPDFHGQMEYGMQKARRLAASWLRR